MPQSLQGEGSVSCHESALSAQRLQMQHTLTLACSLAPPGCSALKERRVSDAHKHTFRHTQVELSDQSHSSFHHSLVVCWTQLDKQERKQDVCTSWLNFYPPKEQEKMQAMMERTVILAILLSLHPPASTCSCGNGDAGEMVKLQLAYQKAGIPKNESVCRFLILPKSDDFTLNRSLKHSGAAQQHFC
ncbi:hypothetical protein SRHO_G00080460 [Serrasalmus rhombeus]